MTHPRLETLVRMPQRRRGRGDDSRRRHADTMGDPPSDRMANEETSGYEKNEGDEEERDGSAAYTIAIRAGRVHVAPPREHPSIIAAIRQLRPTNPDSKANCECAHKSA